jgi:hypothetical protein
MLRILTLSILKAPSKSEPTMILIRYQFPRHFTLYPRLTYNITAVLISIYHACSFLCINLVGCTLHVPYIADEQIRMTFEIKVFVPLDIVFFWMIRSMLQSFYLISGKYFLAQTAMFIFIVFTSFQSFTESSCND